MLRIYLDQNKWIDLARAATGHPKGAAFIDALVVCRAAVAAGVVSFPLDTYRYWETAKRRDNRSRNNVADLMLELSRQHTMALPFGILDQELDHALQRRFGKPEHPRQQQVFGIGMRHIGDGRMNWPEVDLSLLSDGDARLPPGLRSLMQDVVNDFVEDQLLHIGPADFRSTGFDLSSLDHGTRFVEWEEQVADEIRKQGYKGNRIEMAMRASDLSDILPAVLVAIERINIPWEEFFSRLGPSGIFGFMDDLPSRDVTSIMRAAKHRQSEQPWEPNDFVDVLALPVAAVYCDVVVTEKQWAHHLRHGKVDTRYNTQLLSNTADLVDVLVNFSVV